MLATELANADAVVAGWLGNLSANEVTAHRTAEDVCGAISPTAPLRHSSR